MIRTVAHAKINWFLEITGKLPNGYHTLDTVFQTISFGDRLTIRASNTLTLTCSDVTLPVDERNLAMKAAVFLRDLLKEKRGAAIHLEKVTPMGAGLGGGSADAAAVLKGLLKLWKRRVSPRALHTLATGLGADVPFFLTGGTCAARGIGEKLRPLPPVPKTWLVLIWPGFGVSTPAAYGKVRLPFPDPERRKKGDPRDHLFNRFESLVFPDHPALPHLKAELVQRGASMSLMSGSGSAVFGVVSSRAKGQALLKAFKPRFPHSWLVHTR
jgi:4-diphosphocytidyl-2-C-methyl-D-erythritol kinase